MGTVTDANIEAWQRKAGIEPATGEAAEKLCELSREAYELIRIIELERSGIRDGDGRWHGCDPLGGAVFRIHGIWNRISLNTPDAETWVEGHGSIPV